MKTCVYVRQSKDHDGRALGVARQREDCEKLAADRGWQVVQVYTDNDVSASSAKPRPEYQRMLADIRAARLDAVVVWDLDRLTRRPIEIEQFIDLADRHQLALGSVGGDCDLSTDNGRMFARIKGAVARAEVERKSARQKRANLQAARDGQPGASGRAFGYAKDGITVVEREADEVRRAYADLLAGRSLRGIATTLNEQGFTTIRGKAWTHNAVGQMLAKARNAGLRTYRGEVVSKAVWEPIVDEDTWRAARGILVDPARRTTTSSARVHLLTGLAVCGRCRKAPMVASYSSDGARVYRCSAKGHLSRRADPIDNLAAQVVIKRLSRPDAQELLTDDTRPDADELRTKRMAATERLDELAAMFARGAIKARQLEVATAQLQEEVAALDELLADTTRAPVLADLVNANDVAAAWRDLTLDRKRAVIDCLMTVTVHPAARAGKQPFDPRSVEITPRRQQ